MVTPNLTQSAVIASDATRRLQVAAGGVIALTALGGLVEIAAPGLAGHTPPHPTLTGSLTDALAILQNNLRVLAAPFLLYTLGFPSSRLGRRAGDTLMLPLAAASTIPVGIALARWQGQLTPYLPGLPTEDLALTVAVAAWLTARTGTADRRQLAVLAAGCAVLLTASATLETWCTPHRATTPAHAQPQRNEPRA